MKRLFTIFLFIIIAPFAIFKGFYDGTEPMAKKWRIKKY